MSVDAIPIWAVFAAAPLVVMLEVELRYRVGRSRRRRSVSFALVFALIASLDRLDHGALRVQQQPLIDLRASMAHRTS